MGGTLNVGGELVPAGQFPVVRLPNPNRCIYVDGTALFNGDGSIAAPCNTISNATAIASSDSIFIVASGTYTEDVHLTGTQSLICRTPILQQNDFPVLASWPITIIGDIFVTFPAPAKIGISDLLANDVHISCTSPGNTNSLQINRCFVRDIIATDICNVKMKGVGALAGNSDSCLRSVQGFGVDLELYGSHWGLSFDGTYTTLTSQTQSFQTYDCVVISLNISNHIFCSATGFCNFQNSAIFGQTIINFTTSNKSLTIYPATRCVGGTLSVTGTGSTVVLGASSVGQIVDTTLTPLISSGSSGQLGFFSQVNSPITQPNVTGGSGSSAALSSLTTALTNLGLVTNGTTTNPSIANLTTLAAINGYPIASVVRVTSVGSLYESVPSGTSTADGITYITGSSVDWQRIPGTSDIKFLTQATWYVDTVTGNDENTGVDAGHALKSTDEIQRRWGSNNPVFTSSITINIVNAPDDIRLYGYTNAGISVTVNGVLTIAATGTVGSYVAKSGNTSAILTVAGIADLTPHLGKLIYFATGDAYACIEKINPYGGGNNTARITLPLTSTGWVVVTSYLPVTSEAVTIYNRPSCKLLDIGIWGSNQLPSLTLYDLLVSFIQVTDKAKLSGGSGSLTTRAFGCVFTEFETHCSYTAFRGGVNRYLHYSFSIASGDHIACAVEPFNGVYKIGGDRVDNMYACMIQSIGIWNSISGKGIYAYCEFYDSPVDAIYLYDGAYFFFNGPCSGAGAAGFGILFQGDSSAYCQSGIPTVTGATGDIGVRGIGTFSWSEVPLCFAHREGTATLISGTATVIVKNMPTDVKINVTRNTSIGKIGELSVPQATRTNLGTITSQFVVNSSSSADGSTFDWKCDSPSFGYGGIFIHD